MPWQNLVVWPPPKAPIFCRNREERADNQVLPRHSQRRLFAKAFAAATLLVFGGVTALSLYTAHKLDLHSANDVRTKGRDAIQPQVNKLKERMSPLRTWADNVSRRWHMDENKEAKENTMIKEFSKAIGVKTSN